MSRYDKWLTNLKKEITVTINRMEKEPDFAETGTLIFDAVNDNLDFVKESIGGNPRKVIATEYWDDRNFNIDLI